MTAILHHIDGQLKENIYGEYSFVERLQYIEDISWLRGDTNFIFEC